MPYLTLTENLQLQLSAGLVASYDIQPGNGVGLFWDKHTHVYLLTYLPRTHTGLQKAVRLFHYIPLSMNISKYGHWDHGHMQTN